MPAKLSIVRPDNGCEGAGKGAQIIQLPVTPKLRAIDGGKIDTVDDSITEKTPYAPYHRSDIGIGHHNAQRPWEVQRSTHDRVSGVMAGGVFIWHLANDKFLAASTTVRRADGVMMTIELTRNAYEQLTGTRLRVPTDIGEYDY